MCHVVYRFTCKVGDEVRVDDNVMEIETDKTTVGVPTPVSGVIEEIYVQDGDTVKAGQQLFKIKPGEVSAKPAAAAPDAPKPAAPTPAAQAPPAPKPAAAAAASAPPPPRVSLSSFFFIKIKNSEKNDEKKLQISIN